MHILIDANHAAFHRVLIYSFGLPLLCIGYALGQGQNYQPAAEDYGCSQAQKYDEF